MTAIATFITLNALLAPPNAIACGSAGCDGGLQRACNNPTCGNGLQLACSNPLCGPNRV